MGVNYWTGAASGDFSAAGNWTGIKPAAADEVIFDGRALINEDTEDCSEGMLPSESGNLAFDLIHVKSDYAGDIGTAAEPLAIGTAAGNEITVIFEGSGALHLMVSIDQDDALDDAVVPRVIVNGTGTVYLYSLANSADWQGSFTDVYLVQGTLALALEVHGGVVGSGIGPIVTNLYLSPKNNKASNAICTIAAGSYNVDDTTYTNLYMQNGTLTTDSGLGVVHLIKGTLNIGTDVGGGTNVDIVTNLIMTGGILNWNPNESSAYIEEGHIFGGTLQCSKTINETNTRVLGAGANDNIYVYEGATLDLATGRGLVSVAGSAAIINLGGTIITDRVSTIAVAYNPDLGS